MPKKEYLFTFAVGTIKFLVTKENSNYGLWIEDGHSNQCLFTLNEEDYKKMISNYSEIIMK